MERKSVKQQFKDFHEHQPLVLNEELWDESKRTKCSACGDLLSGQSYSCAECQDFHLHRRCAEAPSEVNDLPVSCLPASHLFLEREVIRDTCYFCCENGYGFFYRSIGPVGSDEVCMKCALFMLNNNENNEKLKVDYHFHPLLVVANHKDELKRIKCTACGEALSDSICVCFDCRLYLHKKCTDQLPLEINHPCHRRHRLYLISVPPKEIFDILNMITCEICKEKIFGLSYRCSCCEFYIHVKCAFLGSFNNIADETHQHTFNFVWRRDSFICDACGTEGHYASKVCSTCAINVHMECTSLPTFIRIVRHPEHSISHNYFVKENGLHQKHDCRICYKDEVKKEYGCYSCSKEDCNYIVHVNCALVEGEYRIVDKDEPEDSVEESFRIIERNEAGEAVKIQHFIHDHYLILGDNKEGDDQCCDGCMTFLVRDHQFYYCSQCDFFLHKTCAELPKKKNYWFHRHPMTLELASPSLLMMGEKFKSIQASVLPCQFCHRVSSGLFYYCYECNSVQREVVYSDPMIVVCLRCVSLPDALVHPGHEHLIHFDSKHEGKCIGCGDGIYRKDRLFGCKECNNYGLDYKCMTLPTEGRHKFDKHRLRLVHRDESDDSEKHYCDVCEEKRDPNHWFYFCSICDNSVHPKCVLGEHPFIKMGSTYTDKDAHPHPLTFVKKVDNYPECSKCGEPCLDLALECAQSECNHIVHLDCL